MNKLPQEPADAFVDNFQLDEYAAKGGSMLDLVRYPATRRNSLIMCLCWLAFSMGYFGLFYNTPAFQWNPFLVFMFPAFLALPMNFIEPHLENYIGRKAMLTSTLIASGLLLFVTLAFPEGSGWIIGLAWAGTLFCGAAFGAGYTFTKELYPTTLRTTALGTASAAARLGSILSPLVAATGAMWGAAVPLVVYGAVMLASGVLSVWIWPETNALKFPYTLEECEAVAASENRWLRCGRRKKRVSPE